MSGLLSTTAKSSIRPPITAGPISRNSSALNLSIGADSLGAAALAFAVAACSLSLFFDLSFWPAAGPTATISIPHNATVIRMHFIDIIPPTDRFRNAHRGAAHHTAPARRHAAIDFQEIATRPF